MKPRVFCRTGWIAGGVRARHVVRPLLGAVLAVWSGVGCSRTGALYDERSSLTTGDTSADASACRTCPDSNAECGIIDDGCGHRLVCGDCTLPETCGGSGVANRCGCASKTCADLGAECGEVFDGCDGLISCGSCPAGQVCGGAGPNRCGDNLCTPTSCARLGIACGWVSDGCSGVLNCGGCVAPETCGGGGRLHECGCSRATCAGLGAVCGQVPDGCGGRLDCGDCLYPDTCGVGGPNRCGCVPTSCAALNAYCGTMLDGCGGLLSCGVCSPDEHGGNRHGGAKVCIGVGPANCSEEGLTCTPATCQRFGARCGQVADGCGGVLDCGSCAAPQTCGGDGVPNQCGCASSTCDHLGANCGQLPDGCGATLDCGSCADGQICDALIHRCQPVIE
jgi:hypothetical protein